jgi:hypothetical protein
MSRQQLQKFVATLLPTWRKTRQEVLRLGAQALIQRRRLTLCGIARGLPPSTRVIHRVKRVWRFINNFAIDPRDLVGALAREAFSLRTEGWVPVVLDETGLKDRAMLLGAAVCYQGRALPLALYAYRRRLQSGSLWKIREGLLAVVLAALPKRARPRLLLVADRGYAASHFFRRLLHSKVSFVIRVPRRVLLYMAHGTHHLEHLAADLDPGDSIFLTEVWYGPARAKLNLLLCWQTDQPEPWLLATTLSDAHQTRCYYRQRMGIEELFKDLKGTFVLEACQCQSLDRITRLALFALLSFWALALLVRYPELFIRFVTARGKLSFLTLALEWQDTPPKVRSRLLKETQSG